MRRTPGFLFDFLKNYFIFLLAQYHYKNLLKSHFCLVGGAVQMSSSVSCGYSLPLPHCRDDASCPCPVAPLVSMET